MEENYLFSLFVIAIFGFVLFKKDKTQVTTNTSTTKKRVSNRQVSGSSSSGVAKYLQNQLDKSMESKVSGVAKYLQEKEQLDVENAESQVISSVEKYLASKQQATVSGVSKYMAKLAVHQKKMAKENVSGVEKYLNNRG
ncbi:MAG: hypothetical protein ACKE51_06300 [Methylococcaceae bacterium]